VCTLAVLLGQSPRYPLIVAANRDESRERPSRPPFVWDRRPQLVAGQDVEAGGTWLGLNEHGLLCGLTNLWTAAPADPTRASRGGVVVDALAHATLSAVRRWVEVLDPQTTNPFLLVCADVHGRGFWAATADGLVPHDLDEGVHAFGNHAPTGPPQEKLSRMTRHFERAWTTRPHDADAMLPVLREALASHTAGRGPRESICVHTDTVYQTVSSTIALLNEDLAGSRLYFADGPPCTTAFVDVSTLLRSLG
jgi:uncharacterized protein with NRDE domain